MKREDNQQNLGQAIHEMISSLGMEEKILDLQVQEVFTEMMGNYIMKYVEKLTLRKQVLIVSLSSPELRNELLYGKAKIISHINSSIGKEYLKDVKFV